MTRPANKPHIDRTCTSLQEMELWLGPSPRMFGDLLEQRTRGFEVKLAELTGAVDILRGAQPPPPAQFPSIKAWQDDVVYHKGDIVAFAGGCYQATKDTVCAPGAKDWVCLARSGDISLRAALTMTMRTTVA
jgi:hypothetical protein